MKLTTTSLVIIVLMVVLTAVVIRIMMKTPVMLRLFESFDGSVSGQLLNSSTECPSGYQLYMYDGAAYCCRGNVNPDASNLKGSCIPQVTETKDSLCSLGPSTSVPNCNDLHAGILQAKGEAICPPSRPNFCNGPTAGSAGRCCASAVNEKGTDCIDTQPSHMCDVGTDPNIFKNQYDCRYARMRESDTCPAKYSMFSAPVTEGPLEGLAIYGCTNFKDTCHPGNMIAQLKALNYDVSDLKVC